MLLLVTKIDIGILVSLFEQGVTPTLPSAHINILLANNVLAARNKGWSEIYQVLQCANNTPKLDGRIQVKLAVLCSNLMFLRFLIQSSKHLDDMTILRSTVFIISCVGYMSLADAGILGK